ncbi:protein WEAK CHLOROPLAST MOVEMENT UNDER BLUE LIGHT 1-like [Curcuma longa]|uniref:protein WEAK CHLOROPLAST MOVEMENT UNDER BLUE LIGHT 1-like n=1 Tax=Curcuma longa TaxID=136217 RepID=UPI003D9E3DFD
MVVVPMLLQQRTEELDQATRSASLMAQQQLQKVEGVELAETSANTTWSKLQVALKDKAAAKESEQALAAVLKALQESEQAALSDQYFTVSKRVHEAVELAHNRLAAALAQIDEAKISQISSLERLKEAYRELEQRKELLKIATEKANKAQEEKLDVEPELKKWRTKLEQRRKANDAVKASSSPLGSPQ